MIKWLILDGLFLWVLVPMEVVITTTHTQWWEVVTDSFLSMCMFQDVLLLPKHWCTECSGCKRRWWEQESPGCGTETSVAIIYWEIVKKNDEGRGKRSWARENERNERKKVYQLLSNSMAAITSKHRIPRAYITRSISKAPPLQNLPFVPPPICRHECAGLIRTGAIWIFFLLINHG